ncbi:MAG: magnesium transporter CorA family protein [Patescibacteria group bacterium]
MVKRYTLEQSKIIESISDLAHVQVYVNLDENERRYLIETLSIDEHTLNSAMDPDELSRLEFEPNHLALIYKRPKNYSGKDGFVFKVASAGLFLFKDQLIVVLPEDIPLFEGKPFAKVQSLNEIMIKLIYRSIFHFLEHLKVINMISDDLEKKINASMENSYLINLFSLEKSLVYYLNAVNSNSVLIDKLKLMSTKIGLSTEESEFLDDMIIENNQCYRQAEIYSNILASLMDARASIVGNNLNVLMKTLNIITIAIMVPTFVVSAFSMNVSIPLQQHQWAFWIIMSLAGLSVAVVTYVWKHKRW